VFIIKIFLTKGTTLFFGCLIGVPFLYISDMIVRKIGSVNVLTIAFILYGVRFFGYSFIWYIKKDIIFTFTALCNFALINFRDPWLCLIFEALESLTIHTLLSSEEFCCQIMALDLHIKFSALFPLFLASSTLSLTSSTCLKWKNFV